ncbi:MAG TPA: GspE/PulE family protein [Oligoflexia bacterium]|nr:GspE/PulE family protein [Oligoflexia bacterium]
MDQNAYCDNETPDCSRDASLVPCVALAANGNQRLDLKSQWRELAYCASPEAISVLSFDCALRLCCLPLRVLRESQGMVLTVIIASGPTAHAIKELRYLAGMDIIYEEAEREVVEQAVFLAYRGHETALAGASVAANMRQVERSRHKTDSNNPSCCVPNYAPTPQLLNAILDRAIFLGASDVHLEPIGREQRLRFRIDGVLQSEQGFQAGQQTAEELIRRIKIVSRLDTTLTRVPQEGGFSYQCGELSVRIRVSLLPQISGEKVVMRLLYNSMLEEILSGQGSPFARLGLDLCQEEGLRAVLGLDRGVLLLSGPTGSGKSTLLYVMLQEMNREWRNIISIEDPVERIIPGINQIEISQAQGLGYAELLPRLLRQDPDAIMLGEIRDSATAITAMNAGSTGTLVLSTVHAGDCIEVFARLLQLGMNPAQLIFPLRLVSSQRLVPRNCAKCAIEQRPTSALQSLFSLPPDSAIFASPGCGSCRYSGIAGRIGVFEILPVTDRIRQSFLSACVEEGFDVKLMRSSARKEGYQPLLFEVRSALLRGEISPVFALRAAGVSPDIAGY